MALRVTGPNGTPTRDASVSGRPSPGQSGPNGRADSGRGAPSFAEVARSAAEELLDLLTAQIKLARAELSEELTQKLRRALAVTLFVPLLLGGYAFAMVALAQALVPSCGRLGALGVVASIQLVAGGLGIWRALSRFRSPPLMQHARTEIAATVQQTLAAVSNAGRTPKEGSAVDA